MDNNGSKIVSRSKTILFALAIVAIALVVVLGCAWFDSSQKVNSTTDATASDGAAADVQQSAVGSQIPNSVQPALRASGLLNITIEKFNQVPTEILRKHAGFHEVSRQDPTCQSAGFIKYECWNCKRYSIDTLDKLPHELGEPIVTEPTCTEGGKTTRICKLCNDYHEDTDLKDALGHNFVTVVVEPTCTEQGYTVRECTRCGISSTEDFRPPHGHSYTIVKTNLPSCTEGGSTQFGCVYCGDTYFAFDADPLGHDYEEAVTEPTCTTPGYTVRTCKLCKNSIRENERPALGHDYSDVSITNPTCTEDGFTTHTCTRCNNSYTDTQVAAVGHLWSAPKWEWAQGNTAATASFECQHDSTHVNSIVADVKTSTSASATISEASVSFMNQTYSETRRLPFKTEDIAGDPISIDIDPEIGEFVASIEGGSGGDKAIKVASVTEGEVYNALSSRIEESSSSDEIAGVYDIELFVDGSQFSEDFGSLTLVFPVEAKYNNRWATVYHCHDGNTSKIESFDKVVASDGKVVLKDVTKLSTFAVAIGDEAKQATQTDPQIGQQAGQTQTHQANPAKTSPKATNSAGEGSNPLLYRITSITDLYEDSDDLNALINSEDSQTEESTPQSDYGVSSTGDAKHRAAPDEATGELGNSGKDASYSVGGVSNSASSPMTILLVCGIIVFLIVLVLLTSFSKYRDRIDK